MPEFSEDWHSRNVPHWESLLAPLAGTPNVHALEVGTFEGRAACWLLEHVLTGEGSTLTVIDTFAGSREHVREGRDLDAVFARFWANIAPYRDRVDVRRGTSHEVLPRLIAEHARDGTLPCLDFAYIDGSHLADDVRNDGALALRMVKPGGLICFDDWGDWRFVDDDGTVHCPHDGIAAFLAEHAGAVEVVARDYQLWVRVRGAAA